MVDESFDDLSFWQPKQKCKTARTSPVREIRRLPRIVSDASRRPDTGVFWDEALNKYLKGAINVNFYNNIDGFYAGDTISGTIDIEIG